jgi:DNA-directed RNA polymerase specialized sigma24 family protein
MGLSRGPAEPEIRYCADDSPARWYQDVFDIAFAVAKHDFGFACCDAEDVAQEMTVRAFLAMRKGPINHSWIRRGSVFLCIDLRRTRKAQERALTDFALSMRCDAGEPSDRLRDVARAVDRLLPAHRDLIRKRYEEGWTLEEIDAQSKPSRRGEYELRKCVTVLRRVLGGDR